MTAAATRPMTLVFIAKSKVFHARVAFFKDKAKATRARPALMIPTTNLDMPNPANAAITLGNNHTRALNALNNKPSALVMLVVHISLCCNSIVMS